MGMRKLTNDSKDSELLFMGNGNNDDIDEDMLLEDLKLMLKIY